MYGYKTEYLKKNKIKTVSKVIRMFEIIEKVEEDTGCDVCCMDMEGFYRCLLTFGTTVSVVKDRLGYLRQYLNWCESQNYTRFNLFRLQPLNLMLQYILDRNRVYYDGEQFEKLCSEIRKSKNGLAYTTFLSCVFYGVEDGDYANLEALCLEHYQAADRTIKIKSGKTISVPEELGDLLNQCAREKQGLTEAINGEVSNKADNFIFQRNMGANPRRNFTLYARSIKEKYQAEVSDIRDSGIFWRLSMEAWNEGYDLREDLQNGSVISTKGDNKPVAYGRMLYQLSLELSWSQFQEKYGGWADYANEPKRGKTFQKDS